MAKFEIRMPKGHMRPYVFWGHITAPSVNEARRLAAELYNTTHRKHPINPTEVRAIEIEST